MSHSWDSTKPHFSLPPLSQTGLLVPVGTLHLEKPFSSSACPNLRVKARVKHPLLHEAPADPRQSLPLLCKVAGLAPSCFRGPSFPPCMAGSVTVQPKDPLATHSPPATFCCHTKPHLGFPKHRALKGASRGRWPCQGRCMSRSRALACGLSQVTPHRVSAANAKSKEQTTSSLGLDLPAARAGHTGSRRRALRHVLQRPRTWL